MHNNVMHAKPPTSRVLKQRSLRRLGDHCRYPPQLKRMLKRNRYRKIAADRAADWNVLSELPTFFLNEGKLRFLKRELGDLHSNPSRYCVLDIHVWRTGHVFLLHNATTETLCYVWLSRLPEGKEDILDWDKRHFESRLYGFGEMNRIHIAEQWQHNGEYFVLLRLNMPTDLAEPSLLAERNYRDIVRLGRSPLSIRSSTDPAPILAKFGFLTIDSSNIQHGG